MSASFDTMGDVLTSVCDSTAMCMKLLLLLWLTALLEPEDWCCSWNAYTAQGPIMNIQPMAAIIRGDMTVDMTAMSVEEVEKTREWRRFAVWLCSISGSYFSPEVFFSARTTRAPFSCNFWWEATRQGLLTQAEEACRGMTSILWQNYLHRRLSFWFPVVVFRLLAYFHCQTSTKQHATITFTKDKFCFQSNLTLTAAFQTSSTPEIYRPEDPNSRRRSNDVTRIHSVGWYNGITGTT